MATKAETQAKQARLRKERREHVKTLEAAGETVCDVCGRPLPPRKGKSGRPRLRHYECSMVKTRLAQLSELLGVVRFTPETDYYRLAIRGDIQADTINRISKTSAKRSDDSRDYLKRKR